MEKSNKKYLLTCDEVSFCGDPMGRIYSHLFDNLDSAIDKIKAMIDDKWNKFAKLEICIENAQGGLIEQGIKYHLTKNELKLFIDNDCKIVVFDGSFDNIFMIKQVMESK